MKYNKLDKDSFEETETSQVIKREVWTIRRLLQDRKNKKQYKQKLQEELAKVNQDLQIIKARILKAKELMLDGAEKIEE